jgi:hypothetical protein
MSTGFEIVDYVTQPILERVVREERLGHEHPRKSRDQRSQPARDEGDDADPLNEGEAVNSISSQHIDLRI